ALAPDWLLAQLRPGSRKAAPGADGEKVTEGHRDRELTSMAGVMRHRGFSAQAIAAALLVENELRCDPPWTVKLPMPRCNASGTNRASGWHSRKRNWVSTSRRSACSATRKATTRPRDAHCKAENGSCDTWPPPPSSLPKQEERGEITENPV